MPLVVSQRTRVLALLIDLCKAAGGGRYFVRRGPINWAEFDFSRYQAGIAILTPEFTLLGTQLNSITITLELVQRIPEADRGYMETDGLNDQEIEGLVEDARIILLSLNAAKDAQGSVAVLRIVDNRIEGQEMSNLDFSVQGVMVTFTVEY